MGENMPISVILGNAAEETRTAIERVRQKHSLRPCVMAVIVSAVLGDVRNDAIAELISETNTMIAQKNEELEKAKKAAKRILKTEPDEEQTEQDALENPEE